MEPAATASMDTALPLRLRLKRAVLIALLLGLWAPVKILWEQRIADEQDALRYNGVKVTVALRDKLSQGFTIGVLAGMKNIAADLLWLTMVPAWENQDWWKMGAIINVCTALQPRAPVFWDMGGWELAWNASMAAKYDMTLPTDLRRLKAERFWVERGLDVYLRGIENNPNYWRLWQDTAMLYDQRLHEYAKAAFYYQRASELPGAPVFLERFPAHMYDHAHLNDPAREYEEWVKLWTRLTPEQKKLPMHTAGEIERNLRVLETKLAVPNEKRIFPN
jgi:hypothetical protein